jgi:hypothetical protein
MTKAPHGGETAGPSPVDRRKGGLKRSVASDGDGIPLGLVSAPAQRHDLPLLAPTLAAARSQAAPMAGGSRRRGVRCPELRPGTDRAVGQVGDDERSYRWSSLGGRQVVVRETAKITITGVPVPPAPAEPPMPVRPPTGVIAVAYGGGAGPPPLRHPAHLVIESLPARTSNPQAAQTVIARVRPDPGLTRTPRPPLTMRRASDADTADWNTRRAIAPMADEPAWWSAAGGAGARRPASKAEADAGTVPHPECAAAVLTHNSAADRSAATAAGSFSNVALADHRGPRRRLVNGRDQAISPRSTKVEAGCRHRPAARRK